MTSLTATAYNGRMVIMAIEGCGLVFNAKTGRRLFSLEGHIGRISCLVISEKESAIFTASTEDKTFKKWDLTSGALLASLDMLGCGCLAILENQNAIFAGGTVTINKWDLTSSALLATFGDHAGTHRCFAISEKENAIFSGQDKDIRKYDLKSSELQATLEGHSDEVCCLVISEKVSAIFSSSADITIKKWELKSGVLLATLEAYTAIPHIDRVKCLAISEKEGVIFSCNCSRTQKWDLKSGALLDTLKPFGFTDGLVISKSQNTIFNGSSDKVRKLDVKSSAVLATTVEETGASIACFTVSEEQNAIFTASDKSVRKYDLTSGAFLATLEGHSRSVPCVAISEKENAVFIGSEDNTLNKFDLTSGEVLATLKAQSNTVGTMVQCFAISEEENAIFSGSNAGMIKKWDLTSGARLATLENNSDERINCLAISKKENAIFSGSRDKTIKKWDLKSSELVATLVGHSDPVMCLAISEKENAVFTGSDDYTIKKWDLKSGALLVTLQGHSWWVRCLAISEKENAIFTGSTDKTIKKWDLTSGELLATLEWWTLSMIDTYLHAGPKCLAISEQQSAIFSGDEAKIIKKWDLQSGALLATLEGHAGEITCLAISEKEHVIVTGSVDKTVRVWDCSTLSCIHVDTSHSFAVQAITINSNGMAFSVSTKLVALDLHPLVRQGVVVSTSFAEPGWSFEKRFLPYASFMFAVITKVATMGQLASLAFLRNQSMPSRWVPPARAFDRLACLGLNFEDIIEFDHVFIIVCAIVWMSFLGFCATGPLRDHVTFNPDDKVAKYSFLALGFYFQFIGGAALVPFIKVCLWPLADADVIQGACGLATALTLITLALRLASIDWKLNRVGSFVNPCAWGRDRHSSQSLARNYIHPLSSKSPQYDIMSLVIRPLFMLNSLFLSSTPFLRVVQASMRIVLGIVNLIASCASAPYFKPVSRGIDQNAMQTAIDASLVAIYIAALAAVLAANYFSSDQLESVWLAVMPLLAIPTAWISYNMRKSGVALALPSGSEAEPLLTNT